MHVPRPPSKPKGTGGTVNINQRVTPKPPSAPRPPNAPPTRVKARLDDEEESGQGLVAKMKQNVRKRLDVPKAHTRMIVCALAVSLLWASSLVVCRLIVYEILPRPTLGMYSQL